ncbi:MAG: hypothetical protein H7Y22_02275 [Gemmatimonadaceae bacterium]|nr:hypothetical protein [Gloeobacterales cyanobacterium ES-bin-141]
MNSSQSSLCVRSLICHRHVEMALTCLGSLVRFSTQPLRLVIHDDGSLTKEDIARFEGELPGTRVLLRAEADERMDEGLQNYPEARSFRSRFVYGLKLFDIPLLSEGDIAYCDSDILFLRPFFDLFCLNDPKVSALFMIDTQESYSLAPWQLLGAAFRLPSRVNAGLIAMRKSAYDMDFIEQFIGRARFDNYAYWAEQTCYAALGYQAGCRMYDPDQVVLVDSAASITEQAVAGHFVSMRRHLLDQFVSASKEEYQGEPVAVRTVPPQDCKVFELTKLHFRRQLGRAKANVLSRLKPVTS